ncbi:MAG: serine hydrolase [Nocardiaceae bacterium]|nr:serine hydrolase [Nocardiaceae bacterium]
MKNFPTGIQLAGGRLRRRRSALPIALLATAALAAGCSSSDGYSLDPPKNEAPPMEEAGSQLPDDSVNKALAKLDDLINDTLKKSGVPGVATAVVHEGKIVYAKGFGVRNVEHPDQKVDADTVFQLASVSKSVTSTVVAAEIAKGNVTWDTRVTESMPDFQLADPWVSTHVTVGDGLSHRTGLPGAAGDKLEDLGYDRSYVLGHLRLHKLNPFRISYAYSNFGYTMGAEAVAKKAGKEWADLAADDIYKPLGMNSTSSWFKDFEKRENRATLHQKIDGKFVPGLVRDPDQQDPAGGVSSSVNDMAKWLQLVLGDGTFEGKQIYKPEDFQPAATVQIVARQPKNLESRAGFYGFGWNVLTGLTGRTGFNHSGAFVSGAATNVSVIPSAKVAIVTLTNAWPFGVPETINDSFTDLVQYGSIKLDYLSLMSQVMAPLLAPVGSLVGQKAPANAKPAKANADYVGTYGNDYYGPAAIREKDGGLELAMGKGLEKTHKLTHWDGDTFTFDLDTENAPPGSISKATFEGNTLKLEYYDDDGMGTFTKE